MSGYYNNEEQIEKEYQIQLKLEKHKLKRYIQKCMKEYSSNATKQSNIRKFSYFIR